MATIIVGTYMVRYPLGGNLSWALQYLVGLRDLGHEVFMVEKYVYENSCYDPAQKKLSNDCNYGIRVVNELLSKYGLGENWCYVEYGGIYHGISKRKIEEIFSNADFYIENGAHRAWNDEAFSSSAICIYIDVDPALSQISLYHNLNNNLSIPPYHHFFTNGMNVGKPGNILPTCGIQWKPFFNPVNCNLFSVIPPNYNSPYSTILNWVSYREIVTYKDVAYGHKDIEFDKFLSLPRHVNIPLEIAVSGLPLDKEFELKENGWQIKSAQELTLTIERFKQYVSECRGEFSVVKNMYLATWSGWFSDKSAAFMASGKPVVLQDTGFSEHLPVGEGLFAVNNIAEAASAIECIESNYQYHSKIAFEIANEYLDAKKVLNKILSQAGI